MSNDDDLYSDLPEHTHSDYIAKLETQIKTLQTQIKTLQNELKNMHMDLTNSENERIRLLHINDVLRKNMSSLFKTARSEVERKETMLNELRAEYDNMAFRRRDHNHPYKHKHVNADNTQHYRHRNVKNEYGRVESKKMNDGNFSASPDRMHKNKNRSEYRSSKYSFDTKDEYGRAESKKLNEENFSASPDRTQHSKNRLLEFRSRNISTDEKNENNRVESKKINEETLPSSPSRIHNSRNRHEHRVLKNSINEKIESGRAETRKQNEETLRISPDKSQHNKNRPEYRSSKYSFDTKDEYGRAESKKLNEENFSVSPDRTQHSKNRLPEFRSRNISTDEKNENNRVESKKINEETLPSSPSRTHNSRNRHEHRVLKNSINEKIESGRAETKKHNEENLRISPDKSQHNKNRPEFRHRKNGSIEEEKHENTRTEMKKLNEGNSKTLENITKTRSPVKNKTPTHIKRDYRALFEDPVESKESHHQVAKTSKNTFKSRPPIENKVSKIPENLPNNLEKPQMQLSSIEQVPYDTPRKFINGELTGFPFKFPFKIITPIKDTPDYLKEKLKGIENKSCPVIPMLNEFRVMDNQENSSSSVVKIVENNDCNMRKLDINIKSPFKNCGVVEITSDCPAIKTDAKPTVFKSVTSNCVDAEQGVFSRKGRKRPIILNGSTNVKKVCTSS